jgi:hypothetical protein
MIAVGYILRDFTRLSTYYLKDFHLLLKLKYHIAFNLSMFHILLVQSGYKIPYGDLT